MPFAVVQDELKPVTVEQLRRAFAMLPNLTKSDAPALARDAFGIITGKMALGDARALQRALQSEGVATQVVDEKDLPELGQPQRIKRCDVTDDALVAYDALGRPEPTNWAAVTLLAAGRVPQTEFKRMLSERTTRGIVAPHPEMLNAKAVQSFFSSDIVTREAQNVVHVLEIILNVEPWRYRVVGEEFIYSESQKQVGKHELNFANLVRSIAGRARIAALNIGAAGLANKAGETFCYPSRHAFEEECIWRLMQIDKQGR